MDVDPLAAITGMVMVKVLDYLAEFRSSAISRQLEKPTSSSQKELVRITLAATMDLEK